MSTFQILTARVNREIHSPVNGSFVMFYLTSLLNSFLLQHSQIVRESKSGQWNFTMKNYPFKVSVLLPPISILLQTTTHLLLSYSNLTNATLLVYRFKFASTLKNPNSSYSSRWFKKVCSWFLLIISFISISRHHSLPIHSTSIQFEVSYSMNDLTSKVRMNGISWKSVAVEVKDAQKKRSIFQEISWL